MSVAKLIASYLDPSFQEDDSMTILMAFQTPEVEVIGLTRIFGNVYTEDAARNTLLLHEMAGYPDVLVAEGSLKPLKIDHLKKDYMFGFGLTVGE